MDDPIEITHIWTDGWHATVAGDTVLSLVPFLVVNEKESGE